MSNHSDPAPGVASRFMDVKPPTPTCPWPTEGESWTWDCHQKGATMTPYNDRMKAGHYGKPVATTTSKDLGGTTKAKTKTSKRSSK